MHDCKVCDIEAILHLWRNHSEYEWDMKSNSIKIFAYWNLSCCHSVFDTLNLLVELPVLLFKYLYPPLSSALPPFWVSINSQSMVLVVVFVINDFLFIPQGLKDSVRLWVTRVKGQSTSLILVYMEQSDRLWQVMYLSKYMQNFRSWHFGSWHFGKLTWVQFWSQSLYRNGDTVHWRHV